MTPLMHRAGLYPLKLAISMVSGFFSIAEELQFLVRSPFPRLRITEKLIPKFEKNLLALTTHSLMNLLV